MNFVEVIKTFFEFAAVVLLIVGFINEKKVFAFEQKLFRAIRIHLRNRRLRKQREALLEDYISSRKTMLPGSADSIIARDLRFTPAARRRSPPP